MKTDWSDASISQGLQPEDSREGWNGFPTSLEEISPSSLMRE